MLACHERKFVDASIIKPFTKIVLLILLFESKLSVKRKQRIFTPKAGLVTS